MRLDREGLTLLLREALDAHASDIHLKASSRPALRIADDLVAMAHPVLSSIDTERAAGVLLRMAQVEQSLKTLTDSTFVLSTTTLGRLQVRIFRQRGGLCMLLRPLPQRPPGLASLGVPEEVGAGLERSGITLVSGLRRHVLTTALVDAYNHLYRGHVLMLEKPILSFHKDHRAQVSQREIGRDTATWLTGVEGALDQDVDLLALSGRPSVAVRRLLIQAAEEGRSVLVAVPAASPEFSVASFLEGFEGEERQRVGARLNNVLQCSLGLGRGEFLVGGETALHYSAA